MTHAALVAILTPRPNKNPGWVDLEEYADLYVKVDESGDVWLRTGARGTETVLADPQVRALHEVLTAKLAALDGTKEDS